LLAVTACSGGGSGDGTPSDVSNVTAPATGTISYEAWTPTATVLSSIVDAFTKANPGVKISTKLEPNADYLANLKTELASGTGPDVFVLPPGAQFNQFKSFMAPLDDYAAASLGSGWASKFDPAVLGRAQPDGKTLGLPLGAGAAGLMWVNKSLLDQYQLPVPQNYDQLKSDAAALQKVGVAGLALGAKDTWQDVDYFMAIASSSAKSPLYAAMEGKGKWTDPALVQAFTRWGQLFKDGVLQQGAVGAGTYNDTYNLWLDQKAAFLANGSWNMDMFVNSADKIGKMNVVVVPFIAPGGDGYAPITDDPNIVMVNKNAKNKAAAYKLAEFMAAGAGAQQLNNAFLDFSVLNPPLQPTTALTDNAKSVRASISQILKTGKGGYRNIPSAAVNDALGQALQGVASGQFSPDAAAKQVQTAADGG
jgi:raffinose/stachyose/melibiose transport system substrate-binding protein